MWFGQLFFWRNFLLNGHMCINHELNHNFMDEHPITCIVGLKTIVPFIFGHCRQSITKCFIKWYKIGYTALIGTQPVIQTDTVAHQYTQTAFLPNHMRTDEISPRVPPDADNWCSGFDHPIPVLFSLEWMKSLHNAFACDTSSLSVGDRSNTSITSAANTEERRNISIPQAPAAVNHKQPAWRWPWSTSIFNLGRRVWSSLSPECYFSTPLPSLGLRAFRTESACLEKGHYFIDFQ